MPEKWITIFKNAGIKKGDLLDPEFAPEAMNLVMAAMGGGTDDSSIN